MSQSGVCSTLGSGSCTSFPELFPVAVVYPLTSLVPSRVPDWLPHFSTTFEVPITTSLQISCCCCCTRQLLFSVTLGAGLGVESFEQYSISFLRDYSGDAISWHRIVGDDRKWLCLPEVQSQILCFGQLILTNKRHPENVSNDCDNALSEKSCNHHGVLLHLNFHQKGFRGVKKTACRALSLVHQNQYVHQDRLNAPRTTCAKDVLFPVVWNRRASHQFQHYLHPTRVSLSCSKVTQGILWSTQNSTHFLLFFSWISRIQYLSEKCCAPCFPNAFSKTSLTVFHWYDPSSYRSSWS